MHRVWLLFAIGCGTGDATIDRTYDPCAFDIANVADAALGLWSLERVPGAESIEVRFQAAAPSFHGFYDDETGVVYINDAITDPRALSIVIAHELGHAFGLPHVSERASVMNRGNVTIVPNDADREMLATSSCERSRS